MKERIERVVQVAKEKNDWGRDSVWRDLKDKLKLYAFDEAEKMMIEQVWWEAERQTYIDKWDEDFLSAIAGEYKTEAQLQAERELQMWRMQNQALQQQAQQNIQIAQAQNQQNPYQNAGLLNGLKGLLGGK